MPSRALKKNYIYILKKIIINKTIYGRAEMKCACANPLGTKASFELQEEEEEEAFIRMTKPLKDFLSAQSVCL